MTETLDKSSERRYRGYLETELRAAGAYKAIAETEKDPDRAAVFEKLVEAELRHASRWAEKLGMDGSTLELPAADLKLRLFQLTARVFGTRRVLPWLLRGEAREIDTYASDPEAQEERRHALILRELAAGPGRSLADGGGLRAAVLGVNDGLVSNFSLVMGVAGGTSNADFVLLAGVAGLFAGAFSMAAGEYVSVRSQRDVYENRIRLEQIEIEQWPEEEEEELTLIYQAKGFSRRDAARIAKQIMTRPQVALDTMVREELGLDPSQLGSPTTAAASSFVAFIGGAIVPILPYILDAGSLAFTLSASLSAAALVVVGGLLSALAGKSACWGALRMLLAGGAAAAVTYGVGHLIGVSVLG